MPNKSSRLQRAAGGQRRRVPAADGGGAQAGGGAQQLLKGEDAAEQASCENCLVTQWCYIVRMRDAMFCMCLLCTLSANRARDVKVCKEKPQGLAAGSASARREPLGPQSQEPKEFRAREMPAPLPTLASACDSPTSSESGPVQRRA